MFDTKQQCKTKIRLYRAFITVFALLQRIVGCRINEGVLSQIMKVFILIVLSVCINKSFSEDDCNEFKTCGECVSFPRDTCVWCSAPNMNITKRCQPRTFSSKKENKNWCKGFVYDPKQELPKTVDEPFRSAKGNILAVQFRPQHMSVNLRPGNELKFTMSFKHADDFPLDVYYLMDFSYTMKKHVNMLRQQSEKIKTQLTAFTNNVRFGLGSFIEKSKYPFVGTENRAYAFRNNLNLTTDMTLFDKVLSEKWDYSNYDLPEAGLDGLMQVMACDKRLGWRPNANRIIVVCTDAPYHSAGDGKAVLAYKPNDMKCHLNQTDYYSDSLKYDYPSVSQINKMARDGKFKIIFATLFEVIYVYQNLVPQIYGAKYALLGKKNIVASIIKEAYLESIRYVTMQYQFPPYVQMTLDPDCSRPGHDACRIGHKTTFTMNATLKVTSCPPNPSSYHHSLEIGPVEGGLKDKLKIDLEIVNCQCDCEKDNSRVPNSSICNKFGTFQCGICLCNKDKHGEFCACDGSVSNKTGLEKCKNVNDTKYCSGKGSCDGCGKCTCKAGFSGNFCEFDDNSCKKRDNRLCSGNGRCHLGSCECFSEAWIGDDCGCSATTHSCYAPYSNEVCSGKGKCVCNKCQCDKLKGRNETYSGFFCDDCEECAEKRCKDMEGYVRCNFMFNKTYCDDQYNQTSNTDVEMLNNTEINSRQWQINARWCRAKLDEKKSIVFIHSYNKYDRILRLLIQKEADVEPEANILIPVGIALGTVILIGLLTVLAWKLLVDEMDRREYEKFMNKAKNEGYNVENPLYQAALVNFSNPTYASEGN